MNSILFVLCAFYILNLAILVQSSAWFRKGLGKVVWTSIPATTNNQSEVLVLTARSTIASLSIKDGSVLWRLPYPISPNAVHPTAVASNGEIVVAQFSDSRIRACHANGSVLLELNSCELHDLNGNLVTYRPCDSEELVRVNVVNGLHASLAEGILASQSSVETLESHFVDRKSWQVYDAILSSEADGRLEAMKNGKILWHLEEGIAHSIDVALYPFKTFPTVVLLSELGFIAGLDGAKKGKLIWKVHISGKCRLIHGHAEGAVIVCVDGKHSTIMALNAYTGKQLLHKTYEDFIVRRAAMCRQCQAHVCVHMIDAKGRKEVVSTGSCNLGEEEITEIHFERGGSELLAFTAQSVAWKIDVATGSKIFNVISDERHPFENTLRPPPIRLTGDRRVLFKYTNQNILLVISFDETKESTYATLLDGHSGQTYEVVEHPKSAPISSGIKGENWFLYLTWNMELLTNEIHIVDMYQQPGHHMFWVQKRLRDMLFTRWNSFFPLTGYHRKWRSELHASNLTCSTNIENLLRSPANHPYVVRSSMVLTDVPVQMIVTKTKMGVTEQSVLFLLDSGQSALVSKSTLDARRPKEMNLAYASEYLRRYSPSLSLQSLSHDSIYVEDGILPHGIRSLSCAPDVSRESSSHIISAGLDLLLTQVHPIGKFDFLDSDFSFFTVLLVIATLLFMYLYSESLLRKTSLSRSW